MMKNIVITLRPDVVSLPETSFSSILCNIFSMSKINMIICLKTPKDSIINICYLYVLKILLKASARRSMKSIRGQSIKNNQERV